MAFKLHLDPIFAGEQEENANNEVVIVQDLEEEVEEEDEEEEEYGVQDFIDETDHWCDIIRDEENEVFRVYACCDLYEHLYKRFETFKDEVQLQPFFATMHVKTLENLSHLSNLALNNISQQEIQEAVAYTLPYLSSFLKKLFPRRDR